MIKKQQQKMKKWRGVFVEYCRSFKNTASEIWCTLLLTEGARSLGLVLVYMNAGSHRAVPFFCFHQCVAAI
ncbi:hypothetical protein [Polycladomyces subterraneus]|uniref:Uncharacterized protein n=1 Tax=Polycladomyces subterraneus TaxID=1016997 RepID=A0ABT8IRC3_9BACL|nr:hypothetical protein [Polycladomyces subterraneus]MDN4594644.1 hypothetical protein [Polycladomyces subterraneus]